MYVIVGHHHKWKVSWMNGQCMIFIWFSILLWTFASAQIRIMVICFLYNTQLINLYMYIDINCCKLIHGKSDKLLDDSLYHWYVINITLRDFTTYYLFFKWHINWMFNVAIKKRNDFSKSAVNSRSFVDNVQILIE